MLQGTVARLFVTSQLLKCYIDRHLMLMLSYCGTDVYYMMKNQMRVENNEGEIFFSFDINIK